jgi:Ser/Thr protein kinase RdoA (MazF antagonist)
MAGLHRYAAAWAPPPGFTRPRYDWDGLFGDNELVKVPAGQVWAHIPPAYLPAFESVAARLRQVMQTFGQGRDVFGLIHADVSLGDNVLFAAGEARLIDFDDCAFGYWMFDAGVSLSAVHARPDFSAYRQAFIDGYSQIRSLSEAQWQQLDLFIAAWRAFEMYWATAGGIPDSRPAYVRWVQRAAGDLLACLSPQPYQR